MLRKLISPLEAILHKIHNLVKIPDLLDCMLKESFVRGVIGGGVTWELGGDGETEKRLSLDMTFMTWLFGLWGLSGLICTGTKARQ